MAAIRLDPLPGQMGARLSDIPGFPGESFGLGFPESIGDSARPVWFGGVEPRWRLLEAGVWEQTGQRDRELSYRLRFEPGEDTVTVRQWLTNESDRVWEHSFAFNCFQCGGAPSIRDLDCARHWCGVRGELRRLIELPRKYGPRPTVQLYSVEGAPAGKEIPFVANFGATPEVTLEGWLAIVARDGGRLVAVVSSPALFLFQNMEYSCIHSAASFGRLEPGQTGRALTRVYFAVGSLADWRARMRAELAALWEWPRGPWTWHAPLDALTMTTG